MLEKEKLRKADIFSGALVFLFGLWIVLQAFKMPMKDSWGGVMNVWYVSPALMPLFIGSVIMLLGAMLCWIGLKTIGMQEFKNTLRWLSSPELMRVLTSDVTMRFYAIALLFVTLVYVNLPRIDFFLCATLFLVAFVNMFYFLDDAMMRKLLFFYLAGEIVLVVYFAFGLHLHFAERFAPATDLLALAFLIAFSIYSWKMVRHASALRKKFRTAMIVAVATPFVVGPIFKYFLMVPLPKEGLVVAVLDYFWYLEFL